MAVNYGDLLQGLLGGAGSLGAAYSAYDLPEKAIGKLESAQESLLPKITQLQEDVAGQATFQPFSVRTGSGTTTIGQAGDIRATPEGALGALTEQLREQAQSMAGQQPVTAQSLFSQMQDMRRPEVERERLAMENRLAAQGRLGTQTAAFGGTPEALALEKAIQEQRSADLLQAQQLAPQLQASNLANIGTALGTSFAPEQQMLSALGAGTNLANIIQSARQGKTEAMSQLGQAGIQSEAELFGAISGLEQARADAYSKALQGLFANQGKDGLGESIFDSIFGTIKDAL